MTAMNAMTTSSAIEDNENRASIAALVKIACNGSNSASLRTTACDCLSDRISGAPELAIFAAQELFAKHEAGAQPEMVFDALLGIIRETAFPTGALFRDAVDALSESTDQLRDAAMNRVMQALDRRRIPSPAVAALINSPFMLFTGARRSA